MDFNVIEHLKTLIGHLPAEEQMRARLAFSPTAGLLMMGMEEVFWELGGRVMGRDALGQARGAADRNATSAHGPGLTAR
ncbi:MAG: hypothetical protein HY719_17845 [Planctomycetes bacterium]|nr:hypothetical protein [Planctomycetota bacterium]